MIGWIIFMVLVTFAHCQTGTPFSDRTLQCQCTCTPVGLPDKIIYTSGNLNVIEKTSVQDKQTGDNIDVMKDTSNSVIDNALSKPVPPTTDIAMSKVDENKETINRKITEFKDVAVSKIKHSLGSGVNENVMKKLDQETKEVVRPQIKWLHSASSNDVLASNVQQPQDVSPKADEIGPQTDNAPIVTGSLMMHKDKSVNENVENGQINDHVSPPSGVVQNDASVHLSSGKTTQDLVMPGRQMEIKNTPTGSSNIPTNMPQVDQHKVIVDQTMSGFESTNTNTDKVAADIGFVLDGSAPNPILSAVMSGMGGTSLGTGYIVENIEGDQQRPSNKGYFMNQNINMGSSANQVVGGISNPSLSQQTKFVVDGTATTMETPKQTTINMISSNNDVSLNTQIKKPGTVNHKRTNLNNNGNSENQKQNNRNNNQNFGIKKQTNWNNNGNTGNQKQSSWNNKGNQEQNKWNNNGNSGNKKQDNLNKNGNSGNNKQNNWNNNGNSGNQKQNKWNNNGNSRNQKQNKWNNNGNPGNQKQTNWNNNGNSSNQKQTNWNNNGNTNKQKQTNWNKKRNSLVKNNQQSNTRQNNNKWQSMNNNQNNGGNIRRNNENQWNTNQMKPFNIQRDQKQSSGWNNNNPNFGNLNWETQSPPTVMSNMPFGGMGMDSLMLFGQHHFKK